MQRTAILLALASLVSLASACGGARDAAQPDAADPAGASPDDPGGANGATTDAPGATPASPGGAPSTAPACRTDLGAQLALLHVPGLAAAIVKDGRIACTAAAGMADVASSRAVTPDTLFLWASVSKTIVATTVMQLFDEGKLALDDDINRYLPFAVHVPSCQNQPITFRQLLTHTSSIIDDDDVLDGLQVKGADSPVALLDFVKGYLTPGGDHYSATKNFAKGCPGTSNAYSNVGATLLAAIVETIAKEPFEQISKERVFAPLGMNETAWRLADLDPTHIATPYASDGGAFTAYGQYGEADWPDGMMRTSVTQLASFLLMNAAKGQYGGQTLLASATVDEMRKRQIPALDDTQGLIWYYETFGASSTDVFGHNGSDDGAASNMFFDPATGAGVILVANADWNDDDDESPAADALMDTLFAEAKQY